MTLVCSLVEACYHPQHSCGGIWFHNHSLCLCVGLRQVCFIKSPPLRHLFRLLSEYLAHAVGMC